MRPAPPALSPAASASIAAFHGDAVQTVHQAIQDHEVVVVGMGWNPHVGRARKALEAAGVEHHYVEFGNYATGWKPRLAIKMWTGWPTFPQVFVGGRLLGGADAVQEALKAGPEGLKAASSAP